MNRTIWIAILLVVSCGDSDEGGGKRKRDRAHDKDDKDKNDDKKLSCEDAVSAFTNEKNKKAEMVGTCIKNEWSRKMKRCVSEAESRSDIRDCEKRHDDRPGSSMWDKMDDYANKVCRCTDMDCMTKAGEQWAKDAAEIVKEAGGRVGEMSEDDKRRSEEISKKISDCTKRVTDELMRKAAGDPGNGGGW